MITLLDFIKSRITPAKRSKQPTITISAQSFMFFFVSQNLTLRLKLVILLHYQLLKS